MNPKKCEPVFVLRAQDKSADIVVDLWADINAVVLGAEHPKIIAARAVAAQMRQWPQRKDPD